MLPGPGLGDGNIPPIGADLQKSSFVSAGRNWSVVGKLLKHRRRAESQCIYTDTVYRVSKQNVAAGMELLSVWGPFILCVAPNREYSNYRIL